ncbi:Gp138 family membrane-puncturing spike protein [Anaerosolibacter sp.]|uniref:Gp138 family membrane-puncturing spike protein n=1 Tax=Anaerosolibacter sp. TaxID=1872527 RepID=UPI0039EEFDBF
MADNINEFVESAKAMAKAEVENIHTAVPGIIQSYDVATGLAEVKPATTINLDGGRKVEYPVITGVPVIFPSGMGGNASITWPIAKGDECIILFAETSIDDWLLGSQSDDVRRFDITDAMCIPGLSKNGYQSLKNNPRSINIQYQDNIVKVGDKIEIIGNDIDVEGARINISSPKPVKFNGDVTITGTLYVDNSQPVVNAPST